MIGCHCEVCTSENPKDKRTRTSLYVESSSTKVVFDTGPDFRMQMLANRLEDLDAVVFTHNHKDHTAGLDDIRPFYFNQGDIPVYGHSRVLQNLAKRFDYIFET